MSLFEKQKFSIFKIFKALIIFSFFISISIGYAGMFDNDNNSKIIYCASGSVNGGDCTIDNGVDIIKNDLNNVETAEPFSKYIQSIAGYMIMFIAIIGVLYIIYAGFGILTAGGNEDQVKKSKKNITHVIIGIVIIYLAYSIITFVIKVLNDSSQSYIPSFYDKTYAYTTNDKNTFDEYKKGIELLTTQLTRDYKINSSLDTGNLDKLEELVNNAISAFPDNNDFVTNNNIAKNLLISIDVVKNAPDSETKITELAKNINDFLNKTKIPRISATIGANPSTGNAPFTTSLKATNVVDPSGVTIPSSNYIWWLKNSDGSKNILGTGPSISYTFKEERTYIVNLDIVSASRNSKGKIDTLPYTSSVNVNVLPKIGTIYFYINGINVSDLDRFKITPQIGKAGIIIDSTASQAAGGSTITKTVWDFGNGNSATYNLYPRIEKQYYANEGNYIVRLKLITNEGKILSKDLGLEVRNPIAAIKLDKLNGFVGEDFKLSANSYFIGGGLNYEWKIIDLSSGGQIFTSSKENVSYKFLKTGKFSVILKSSAPSGKEDTDTRVITIESRNPISSFTSKPASTETPNTYSFDATRSYDPDTFNNSKLKFSWSVDGQKVDLENSLRDGSIGNYTFDSIGTHKVTLEVSNEDGKVTSTKKDINIASLLAIKLNFTPKIAQLGTPVVFIAESKNANSFEWKFGDGGSDITQSGRNTHTYIKAGTYTISITVKGDNSTTNTISRKVYVTNGDSPFALISLKRDTTEIFETSGVCDSKDAYIIDRSKPVELSSENSINADGTNAGFDTTWNYIGKTSNQKKVSYRFDDLGCFPVSLTVKDKKSGGSNKFTTYVKVENLPPKISGLTINTANIDSDPVIVKVTANNAKDDDGVIVSYLWYYYTDSDPEPQDYRITRTPYSTFALPKISGKYYFVLIAEDSNGAKTNTDEMSEDRYFIEIASDNINTPLLDLSVDKTNIAVGDDINFKVSTKDILGRDISSKVEYKWDFDGDGIYDETTAIPQTNHNYTTPGVYTFKVKATYKGVSNTKYQQITVKNVLKPNFEYFSIGNKLVLFNTTSGLYTSANWNLGNGTTSDNLDYFVYDFLDGAFPSKVGLKVFDGNDTKDTSSIVKKDVLNSLKIRKSQNDLIYFTYPSIDSGIIKVQNPKDKIFIYLGESKGNITKYCIDSDTSVDSDLNGTPDDDCDNKDTTSFVKGDPFVIKDYTLNSKTKTIRFSIFAGDNLIEFKDIKVEFEYYNDTKNISTEPKPNSEISDNDKAILEQIKNLIKKSGKDNEVKMMQYLSSIQDNWFDDREKTKSIIDFESFVDSAQIDDKIKNDFYNLLESLLMKDNQTKDEVSVSVKILKSLIPKSNPNYDKITKDIDEILSHPTNTTLNKTLGSDILNFVKDDSNIDNKDKLIIKSQIETIIYGGQSNIPKSVSDQSNPSNGGFNILDFMIGFVKLFGYLLLALFGIIVGFFIYFKVVNKNENLSFQDFLIEKFLREKNDAHLPKQEIKKEEQIKKEDVLNNILSQQEDVKIPETIKKNEILQEINKVEAPETGIPSWLKGSTQEEIAPQVEEIKAIEPTKKEEKKLIEEKSSEESDMPSWLKGMDKEEIEKEVESELKGTKEDKKIPEEKAEAKKESSEESLPDWLKGSINEESLEEEKEEDNINEDSLENKDFIPEIDKSNEIIKESDEEIITAIPDEEPEKIKELAKIDESGLPDWLKGSFSEETTKESKDLPVDEKNEEIPETVPKHHKKNSSSDNNESKVDSNKSEKSDKKPEKKESFKKPKNEIPPNNSSDLPEWLK